MRLKIRAAALAAVVLTMISAAAQGAKLDPERILDRVDDVFRSSSSHGMLTMRIETEHWSRELKLEMWSKGKDNSLIRILAPKKEKGTATLRSGNDIWNYLPKVKRVVKLPSAMMADSWMGSHFTNDDLVKESRMADDYKYEITFNGKRDGRDEIEITCIPSEDAVVVWGKLVVKVGAKDYLPLEILYYDEDLDLARTIIFSDVKELGGKKIPAVMDVVPADKPKERTLVFYEEMEFDVEIADDVFSMRNLQK